MTVPTSAGELFHELMVTENIILQVTAIGIVLVALYLKKKGKYVYHADLMLLALLINLVQLLGHMIPSMVYIAGGLVPVPYNLGTIVVALHAATGFVAEAIGIYVVVEWAFIHQSLGTCSRRRTSMRWIIYFWATSFALGMLYYVIHIVLY